MASSSWAWRWVQPKMALTHRQVALPQRSSLASGTARRARSAAVLTTPSGPKPRIGATRSTPTAASPLPMPSETLAWLTHEVTGWSGNCMHTAERTSLMPAASAISSVAEPTQWPRAWTLLAPVTRRTSATAAGQSSRAMSSIVNGVRADGRSMPAR